jgi:hypothetical protein
MEVFITEIAYVAVIFSVCIPISISLILLGVCFVPLIFVDESTLRDDSQHPEDAESTVIHSPSEAPVLSHQSSGQSRFLTFLRSRKVLFTLSVFILPVLAQNALRWLSAYAVMIRRPDQGTGQILLSLSWGGLFKAVLFALFTPWAIPFVQKRFGIRQSALDVWIIRGSVLVLAFAAAYVTVAATSASRVIGECTF